MKRLSYLLLLILFPPSLGLAQLTVSVDPFAPATLVGNDFKHGIFYVPKTAQAQQEFETNGIQYSAVRLHIVESALNNTSNLNDCLAFLDLAETQLQEISSRSDKVIFIFEKMPAWLSSSSDGAPAQTPGWFVLNTKPPADYNEWNNVVSAITSHLTDTFGINNAFFEIWNEPDLGSWTGTDTEYFELFQNTYDAIKLVDNTLPVGGPATNYWGNHINWQPPYGYLNNTLANASLIGCLLDSTAVWNKPLDFVSWHNFNIIHNIQDNIISYLNQKCLSLGISVPQLIVSEWNTPSAVREMDLQHAYFIKNQMAMAQTDLDAHVIAAWQDFDFGTPEFHGDYGLLSYGAIQKPVYHALQLSNRLSGNYLAIQTPQFVDAVATLIDDTVRVLLTNYAPPPFVEAINHTLFEGGFHLNQLDSAGFIDISANNVSYLDSLYKGLTTITPITPLEIAVTNSIPVYAHYENLLSNNLQLQLELTGVNFLDMEYVKYTNIDSIGNNSITQYEDYVSLGLTQTQIVQQMSGSFGIGSGYNINPSSNSIPLVFRPNSVQLIEIVIPSLLSLESLDKQAQFSIYPNPTYHSLVISSNDAIGAFSIRDLNGSLVFSGHSYSPTEQISLETIDSGMYFIQLHEKEVVRQFVKY